MRIRDKLNKCIYDGKSIRFRNILIYRLTIPEEQIDSLHYKFVVPSNLDGNDNPIVEDGGALIATADKDVFNPDALLKVLYRNREYFTKPLTHIKKKLLAIERDPGNSYNEMLIQSRRFKRFMELG